MRIQDNNAGAVQPQPSPVAPQRPGMAAPVRNDSDLRPVWDLVEKVEHKQGIDYAHAPGLVNFIKNTGGTLTPYEVLMFRKSAGEPLPPDRIQTDQYMLGDRVKVTAQWDNQPAKVLNGIVWDIQSVQQSGGQSVDRIGFMVPGDNNDLMYVYTTRAGESHGWWTPAQVSATPVASALDDGKAQQLRDQMIDETERQREQRIRERNGDGFRP